MISSTKYMQSVGISLGRPKLRGRPSLLDLLKHYNAGSSSNSPKFKGLDLASPELLPIAIYTCLPETPAPASTEQSPTYERHPPLSTLQNSDQVANMPPVCSYLDDTVASSSERRD